VGGRVSQVLFKDGQKVKKGQVLVQFDDQLPSAQLAQSKAELSIAQANHTRNQELALNLLYLTPLLAVQRLKCRSLVVVKPRILMHVLTRWR
jgi:multidrug efflux pump subunit AcrA (membrane-fusion protein)